MILNDNSYSIQVPTTGFSITIANGVYTLLLNPAGTLATGTVTLPASPVDGQFCSITSSQIITALTLSGGSATVINAPSALALGVGIMFIYNLSNTTWFRLY